MTITDELRKWFDRYTMRKNMYDELTAIADRIDAAHDKTLNSVDSAYDSGYNVGYDAGFASAYDWCAQHEDAMAEHGWVKLPKDADGEPIYMEDLVTVPWKDKVYKVAGFSYSKQLCSDIRTIWIDVYSPEKQHNIPLCRADSCHHYHAPNVEDVLREFADGWSFARGTGNGDGYLASFAAKLRLADDVQ